ncbi:unnamed protein product [[Candida] boidinii]|uniref:Unnamed protein product n=1 Tax=Candida boidinii TaxID=5477 RepID=A0ACB5TRI7_CANBO|nr:unnamed protein product [[Candida] boidinii]
MNKNQLLIVGPRNRNKISFVKNCFEFAQDQSDRIDEQVDTLVDLSGFIIDEAEINTKYYTAKVSIWVDEFCPDNDETVGEDKTAGETAHDSQLSEESKLLKNWCDAFISDEYKEVRDALDALVFTFDLDVPLEYIELLIEKLSEITDRLDEETCNANDEDVEDDDDDDGGDDENTNTFNDFQWNGLKLILGYYDKDISISEDKISQIEDLMFSSGFEFINLNSKTTKNEFGEKSGMLRFRECIETHEWSSINTTKSKKSATSNTTNTEKKKISTSMIKPLLASDKRVGENEEDEFKSVEELEMLISKIKNAKISASSMRNKEEREKYANDLVSEIMKLI